MLNIEIWKEIPDLPYDISSHGQVRRHATAAYKHKDKTFVLPYISNKGYVIVNLYLKSKVHKFLLHRLIATAFIPNPDNLPVINHIDGNPLNNSIDNLEWCTQSHNMQHAWVDIPDNERARCASVKRVGASSQYKGVSWSSARKRWCVYVTVDKKRNGLGRFKNEIEAAKAYDIFIKANNLQTKGYSLNFD